jgi:hypothetical protein
MQRPFPNGHKCPFGCNGYVTALAAGQSQRVYSGVGIFNWYYLSSPPQTLLRPGSGLEWGWLIYINMVNSEFRSTKPAPFLFSLRNTARPKNQEVPGATPLGLGPGSIIVHNTGTRIEGNVEFISE